MIVGHILRHAGRSQLINKGIAKENRVRRRSRYTCTEQTVKVIGMNSYKK